MKKLKKMFLNFFFLSQCMSENRALYMELCGDCRTVFPEVFGILMNIP